MWETAPLKWRCFRERSNFPRICPVPLILRKQRSILFLFFLNTFPLKTLDTIGNRQRPVFSRGGSQHMHKVTNQWKFELNRSSKLQDNNERKNTLVIHEAVCFQIWGLEIKFVENYFFLENYVTSEGAVSHNVLYHQQLSIACNQVSFMPNIIFSNYQ